MSRDIKFRVKVTWRDSVWLANVDYMKSDGFGGWYGLAFININSWESAQVEFHTDADDVLMQYTGLKDKNGVEIYEDDITKNHNGKLCKVSFANGSFHSVLIDDDCVSELLSDNSSLCEVIGNIYENPELLEVINE